MKLWVRLAITVAFWIILYVYQFYYLNFDIIDAGIAQVENSDQSYIDLQKWKEIRDNFWMLYFLPIVLYLDLIFKNKEK